MQKETQDIYIGRLKDKFTYLVLFPLATGNGSLGMNRTLGFVPFRTLLLAVAKTYNKIY
jgi:hypothetical protein